MTTSLVVMERGSDWPGQIGDSMNVVSSVSDDDLLILTRAKLDALAKKSEPVDVAALAVSSTVGTPAARRRAALARVLLSAVTRSACGRILLCASDTADDELREQLLALAGSLTKDLWGTTASVSLRFRERAGAVQLVAAT